ncbi:MAG: single-stranded-DNA-specific exonuclease RecJ [Solirubrobacterales bacterium]
MEKWTVKTTKINTKALADSLKISRISAVILANRGIKSASEGEKYINPKFSNMHDGRLMKDMERAVDIVEKAINDGLKIMIVGDYDVDGVISTYILYSALKECQGNVCYEIPHRINDGYGINPTIIDKAAELNVKLIITCDNGISAIDALNHAETLGIDVIVTDHHDIPENFEMIKAAAIVNPKQNDCGYPFKGLCGAGVALKFAEVLFQEFGINKNNLKKYIHAAAIATVCDVVDLIDENRIITRNSLKDLASTENLGLQSLIKVTGLSGKDITTYALGFVIGPCINASGRLDCAKKGVELLLSKDYQTTETLAKELFELNKERKEMTLLGVEKAVNSIEQSELKEHSVLVVYDKDIHESIAGIIAGRLKERYFRPVIFLTAGKHGVKGSGRSIEGYNMFDELTKCRHLLGKFGGHPMAAGMSLDEDMIEMLRIELNTNSTLEQQDFVPKVSIDMQLPINMATLKLAEELQSMEPFGKGNPRPLFAEKNVNILKASILGANKNVLKLSLDSGISRIGGIYFGDIEYFKSVVLDKFGLEEMDKLFKGDKNKVKLDLAYNLNINEYMGNKSVQLLITNFR